jgi:hypothetical protein
VATVHRWTPNEGRRSRPSTVEQRQLKSGYTEPKPQKWASQIRNNDIINRRVQSPSSLTVTCHSWHRQVTSKSRKVASLAQIPALDSRVPSISDAQGCTGERHKQEAQGGAARDMKAAIDQWPARPARQPRLASPRWRLLPSPWRNGNSQTWGTALAFRGPHDPLTSSAWASGLQVGPLAKRNVDQQDN